MAKDAPAIIMGKRETSASGVVIIIPGIPVPDTAPDPPRDALLLKQMLKKQTGFVLLLKQNKLDLVILHQNQNKSNMF